MQWNVTVRFRPTQLLSVVVHGGLSLPILVLKSHFPAVTHSWCFCTAIHGWGCLDCHIHIEPFSSQILLLICVAYFFATPFHFVFPQHRNAVPDISPVPLQVTTDLMGKSVFGHSVLETVVTNHESADRGSSFEPLVVVAVSRRLFLCFQVCFSIAQEGCLVLSLYTAFLPGLATRCLPVLFECITKRDMDRVCLEDLAFIRVIFTVFIVRSINPFDFG